MQIAVQIALKQCEFGLLFSLMLLNGCSKSSSEITTVDIKVEKEVFLPELRGTPEGLAMANDGSFVVVGSFGAAWAARVSPDGKLLWKYDEPTDSTLHFNPQSQLRAVVSLSDGKTLACGQLATPRMNSGLVVILDDTGRLLEHRRVYPDDNGSYLAELWSCQQWGDEIILLGTGTDGKHPGFFWMVGLDSNGNKRWERHGANVAGTEATRLHNGALTIGNFASGGMLARRIDPDGALIIQREAAYRDPRIVHSVEPRDEVEIIATDTAGRGALLSWSNNLDDIQAARAVGEVNVSNGIAFELTGGSIALFGNAWSRGVAQAAVGRWRHPGERSEVLVMPKPDPYTSSYTFTSAIRIGTHRFVALRGQAGNPKYSGVILSWIDFP